MTGQYILHDTVKKKVRMARTIKALPDAEKWAADDVEAVQASPYDLHSVKDQGVTFQGRPAEDDDADGPRHHAKEGPNEAYKEKCVEGLRHV